MSAPAQARGKVRPMSTHTQAPAAGRVVHELVRRRWPIPLAVGILALAIAVAGHDSRPVVGAPLAFIVLAGAALFAAIYALRTWVARRLPRLSPQGLGLFRIAWAFALFEVLPYLRDSVHQAPFPRGDQRTEGIVN